MGIYDREYYRRDGPGFLGSLADQGRMTSWLIGLNIACFILQMLTRVWGEQGWHSPFTEALLLDVPRVLEGQVWRLLTYAFLHDTNSLWHILFNMLFLYWFGRQVEDTIGSREYLWFYLASALVGGFAFVVCTKLGIQNAQKCLGASGAVTAVLLLSACYNPRQIIYVFLILPVPIWGFVIFNIVSDAFHLLGQSQNGVATSVHLAGAAFGFSYYKLGWRISGWTGWFSDWKRRRSKPRLRVYREEFEETPLSRPAAPVSPSKTTPRILEDEHLEAQVDAILEKIPRVGMEGLSESERQVLVRASEAIKRRRS